MARFRYVAKDMKGKRHKGTLEATAENVLQQQLREEGLFLISAKNLTDTHGYQKLKAKQLAVFCPGIINVVGIRCQSGTCVGYYFESGGNSGFGT